MSIAATARRPLLTTVVALLMAAAALPVGARPAAAADGAAFVAMANDYRAGQGIGPLAFSQALDQIAVERGVQISEEGGFFHDFDYLRRRFDELGVCWSAFGEIIAYNSTGDIINSTSANDSFGEQWWNSPTHRSIMLGSNYPFTHASGSRHHAGNRWYGVMVFVELCGATVPPPVQTIAGFTDIASSPFVDDIVWLVEEGITSGCSATSFCPSAHVLRDQMASFLVRAMGLPGAGTDYFSDDAGSVHEGSINAIAAAGVTEGCRPGRYCPGEPVSREQMASFLARALDLPPTSTDYFSDDAGSVHEDAINRLAAAGITGGCAEATFCGGSLVSREQMAAFLHRALR